MAIRRLLVLLPLMGCASGTDAVPADSLQSSLDASRASLRAIQGPRAPGPTPAAAPPPSAPAPPPSPAGAAPAPGQPGGPAPGSAAALMNHTADSIRAWLGEPSLRRPEGRDAEIWLYEAPRCRLDLILYRDGQGPLRVAHAQARSVGTATVTEADCLRDIAGGRATAPAFLPRA